MDKPLSNQVLQQEAEMVDQEQSAAASDQSQKPKSDAQSGGLFGRLLNPTGNTSQQPSQDESESNSRDQQYEALQQRLSDSLSNQLKELKEAKQATESYQAKLGSLLGSGLQKLTSAGSASAVESPEESDQWQREFGHFKEEVRSLMSVVNLQFEEQKQLEEVYRQQRQSLSQLQADYQKIQQRQQQIDEQHQTSDQQNQQRDQWVHKAEGVLSANSELNKTLLADIDELKGQLSQQADVLQGTEKRFKHLSQNMTDQEEILARLQQSVDQISVSAQQWQQHQAGKADVLAEAQSMKTEVRNILDQCNQQLDAQREANSRMASRAEQAHNELQKSEHQLTQIQRIGEEVAVKREAIEQDVVRFKADFDRFQQEKNALQDEMQDQQRGIKQHETLVKEKMSVLDAKMEQMQSIKQESDHVLTLANNARKVANRFNDDVNDKLAEVNRIHHSVEKVAEKTERLSADYDSFKQKLQQFSSDLDAAKAEEGALLSDLSQYKESFREHHQHWEGFKNWCRELSEHLVSAEKQLTSEKEACNKCLSRAEQLIEAVHSDKRSVDVQKEVVQKALGHIKHLFNRVNQLIAEHHEGQSSLNQLMKDEKHLNERMDQQFDDTQLMLEELTAKLKQFDELEAQANENHQHIDALIHTCQSWATTAKEYTAHNQQQIEKMDEALVNIADLQSDFGHMADQFVDMQQQNEGLRSKIHQDSDQLMNTEHKVNESCQVVLSLIEKNKGQHEQIEQNLIGLRALHDNAEVELNRVRQCSAEMLSMAADQQKTAQRVQATEHRVADLVNQHQAAVEASQQEFLRYQEWMQSSKEDSKRLSDQHQSLVDSTQQQYETVARQAEQIEVWYQQWQAVEEQQQIRLADMQQLVDEVREEGQKTLGSYDEINQLKGEANECFNRSIFLKQELQQILAVISDTASDVNQRAEKSGELFDHVQQLLSQHDQLEQEVRDKLTQLDSLRQTCSDTLEQARVLNGQSDESQKIAIESREQVAAITDQTQQVFADVNQRLSEVQQLTQQVADAMERLHQTEARTQSLAESLQATSQSAQDCVKDVYGVKHKTDNLLAKSEELVAVSEQQQQHIDSSLKRQSQLADNMQGLQDELESGLNQISKLENRFQQALADEAEVHAQQAALNQEQQQQLEKAVKAYGMYEAKMNAFIEKWSSSIQHYQELRSDCQTSLSKSEELHTRVAHLFQVSQETQASNRELVDSTRRLSAELEEKNTQYAAVTSEFNSLKSQTIRQAQEVKQQAEEVTNLTHTANKSLDQQKALYLQCVDIKDTMTDSHQKMIDERVRIEAVATQYMNAHQERSKHEDARLLLIEKQLQELRAQLQTNEQRIQTSEQRTQMDQQKIRDQLEASEKRSQAGHHQDQSMQARIDHMQQQLDRYEKGLESVVEKFKIVWQELRDQQRMSEEVGSTHQGLHQAVNDVSSELKVLQHEWRVAKSAKTGFLGPNYAASGQKVMPEPAAPIADVLSELPQPSVSAQAPTEILNAMPSSVDSAMISKPENESSLDAALIEVEYLLDNRVPELQAQCEQTENLIQQQIDQAKPAIASSAADPLLMTEPSSPSRVEQSPEWSQESSDSTQNVNHNPLKNVLFSLLACVGFGLSGNMMQGSQPVWPWSDVESLIISSEIHDAGLEQASDEALRWPLAGMMDAYQIEYGRYRHGVYLPASLGAAIRAMSDGHVVFVGEAGMGVGRVVILQHSNELMSVYGNNQENFVTIGQPVRLGQVIASVGQAFTEQAALYFEIRYQGLSEDPFLYFQPYVG